MSAQPTLQAVNKGRPEPPSLQAYRVLASAIRQGELRSGLQLPSERELCDSLGVSRATLRHALAALSDDGLLRSSPGHGWFVSHDVFGEPPNELLSFSELAQSLGLEATTRVLTSSTRTALLDEAERIGVAPGAQVLDLERLRMLDGLPIAIDRSTLPLSRIPQLSEVDFEATSLHEFLDEVCGIQPTRCEYTVQALAADERTAELLDLDVGAPVLVGWERTFDQNDRPVEVGEVTYRGDRYRFKAQLIRPQRPPRGEASGDGKRP